jgi:hypothetical protein
MSEAAAGTFDIRTPSDRAVNRLVYLGMTTSLVAAPLLSPQAVATGPVLCPFRRLTGLPCPGCGMTRSFVALAHGDVGASFSFHPLGPLMMAIFVVALVWKTASHLSGSIEPPEVVVARACRSLRARATDFAPNR